MIPISEDPERPYVICLNCCRGFDMDWNQKLKFGEEDKEGRFELIEVSEGGEWDAVRAKCPLCHYVSNYGVNSYFNYHSRLRFADEKGNKIAEVIAYENFFLRGKLESVEAHLENAELQVARLSRERNVAKRRYRKARKDANHLADKIHLVAPDLDEADNSSLPRNLKGHKEFQGKKEDFSHYR